MWRIAAVAPQPLAKVVQNLPYYKAAIHSSTAYLVGLPPLV
jgi:hypothetical protein